MSWQKNTTHTRMVSKSFRVWLLVFSLEQRIRDHPPDCDCDGAVGQTWEPMVQSLCLDAERSASSGSGEPVRPALFGSAGLIVCLKRMAIKVQPDDGFWLEAYCDHIQ